MKKLIYLLVLFVTLAACKTKEEATTTPAKKQKTVNEATVADFANILGLQKGDLYDKALKLLGTPTKTTKDDKDTYSFVTCYYDDEQTDRLFSYTYDKKTNALNHFRITGNRYTNFETTRAYLKNKKVNDFKVDFLGMHKDDIIKIMGQPVRVNSGNYEYVQGAVSITFICYDFQEDKCSEMYIFWNYYM